MKRDFYGDYLAAESPMRHRTTLQERMVWSECSPLRGGSLLLLTVLMTFGHGKAASYSKKGFVVATPSH